MTRLPKLVFLLFAVFVGVLLTRALGATPVIDRA